MRLSEAIALGRNLITFNPRIYLLDGSGCLIGMGAAATGKKNLQTHIPCNMEDKLIVNGWLDEHYPWVNRKLVSLPCGCGINEETLVHHAINHLAHHVYGYQSYREVWTVERFLDWLRSVEPEESVSEERTGENHGDEYSKNEVSAEV